MSRLCTGSRDNHVDSAPSHSPLLACLNLCLPVESCEAAKEIILLALAPLASRSLRAVALQQLAHDMQNDATPIRIRSRGPVEEHSMDTSLAFYHLAQEGLSNVKRHSRASRAILHSTGRRRAVWLTGWDNGTGFDSDCIADGRARGAGLHNMKTRVEEAGGRSTFISRQGSTEVTAALPRPLQRTIPRAHA